MISLSSSIVLCLLSLFTVFESGSHTDHGAHQLARQVTSEPCNLPAPPHTVGFQMCAATQTLCGWRYTLSVGVYKLKAQYANIKYMVIEKSLVI